MFRRRNYHQGLLNWFCAKLPAVAAVAEAYAAAEGFGADGYLAGLWRRAFVRQCLWRVWDGEKAKKPEGYRAPTWSWASVEGDVDVEAWVGDVEDTGELLTAETTLRSNKLPFGMVTERFVRLRVRMRRVLWLNHDQSKSGRYDAMSRSLGRDPDGEGADERLTLLVDVVHEWPDDSDILLWAAEMCRGVEESEDRQSKGLLLEDGRDGIFRRVGMMTAELDWFSDKESQWSVITVV
jgi:hypothetical protein